VNWFRQDRAFNIRKAQQQLGYQPRVGIQEGLARTACWYREQGII
jgi:nucleoside-diphosphate-sugar epimerase